MQDPMISPIRQYAKDWGRMTFQAKRQYLIDSCQARDCSEASSLLARHGAACRRRRKARQSARRFIKGVAASAPIAAARTELVDRRLTARCMVCDAPVYENRFYDDGSRERKVIATFVRTPYALECVGCVQLQRGQEVINASAQHERHAA